MCVCSVHGLLFGTIRKAFLILFMVCYLVQQEKPSLFCSWSVVWHNKKSLPCSVYGLLFGTIRKAFLFFVFSLYCPLYRLMFFLFIVCDHFLAYQFGVNII